MREEEQRGKKKRAAGGDCLLLLFKHSADKFALCGIMAVNVLWKVSGDAQRATVIFAPKVTFCSDFSSRIEQS